MHRFDEKLSVVSLVLCKDSRGIFDRHTRKKRASRFCLKKLKGYKKWVTISETDLRGDGADIEFKEKKQKILNREEGVCVEADN